jgi:hypothetical protein
VVWMSESEGSKSRSGHDGVPRGGFVVEVWVRTLGASGVVETSVERRMAREGTGTTSDSELPYTDAFAKRSTSVECCGKEKLRLLGQCGVRAVGSCQTASIVWELDLYLLQRCLRSDPRRHGPAMETTDAGSQGKRLSSPRTRRTTVPPTRHACFLPHASLASPSLDLGCCIRPRTGDGHTPELESDDGLDIGSTGSSARR